MLAAVVCDDHDQVRVALPTERIEATVLSNDEPLSFIRADEVP
jgi:hypothetical protein